MLCIREVAQLVAHYVRDVGVGRSSRLFSTEKDGFYAIFFYLVSFRANACEKSHLPFFYTIYFAISKKSSTFAPAKKITQWRIFKN